MVLEVNNLQRLYRNNRGVREMTFSLNKGDVYGLLGANGAGKTTAMKAICGLCPYNGGITVFGTQVRDNTRIALAKVGCLIETPAFYPYLSARRNLGLAARYYKLPDPDAAIAAALEAVGLTRYQNDSVIKYSLGMKARLGLALCILPSPEFMVLDEPLNGLDIEGMVEIRNIILELAGSGNATFLISSHLAAEIEKTCNRVGVMVDGTLLESSDMQDVLAAHPSVEAYFLHVNGRSGMKAEIGGEDI